MRSASFDDRPHSVTFSLECSPWRSTAKLDQLVSRGRFFNRCLFKSDPVHMLFRETHLRIKKIPEEHLRWITCVRRIVFVPPSSSKPKPKVNFKEFVFCNIWKHCNYYGKHKKPHLGCDGVFVCGPHHSFAPKRSCQEQD